MFTLIAMGTGVAYAYSMVATVAPQIFPPALREHGGGVAVYFEAATMITVLVLLGQVLELRARDATSGAIKALLTLAPKTARRLRHDGSDEDVALEDIAVGDRLRVRPGDKVPVDGEIVEGRSSLDESMVTGESMPVTKQTGAKVIGGTLNQSGSFVMRAEKVGSDTLLSRIVTMVAQAQRSRAPIQRLADRVAAGFVPSVIAVAVVAFAVWSIVGPEPRFAYGLVAAVSVLIIACPCALGLATPMSIMVGVGRGAQSGVLIKNAEALERMERVDTLVIDKTGTLTEGKPKVVAIVTANGANENELLRLTAGVERASEHPLAAAIVRDATERGLAIPDAGEFNASAGKGVSGRVDGHTVAAGNAGFMAEREIDTAALDNDADRLREDGATALFVAIDEKIAGVIAIADPVKPTSAQAVKALAAQGLRVVMLTGDNAKTAKAMSSRRCNAKAASSRWRATASTMRLRWPPPMSASPWAQAPMSRSKAPASRCSTATSPASCKRGVYRKQQCATSARTSFSRFSTTSPACPSPQACSFRLSAFCCRPSSRPPRWRYRRSASSAMRCGCTRQNCSARALAFQIGFLQVSPPIGGCDKIGVCAALAGRF
jgi:Cu+-exporting ATPase